MATMTGSGKDFHLINKHRVIISRTTKKARHEYLALKISLLTHLVFYGLYRLDVHAALAFVFVKFYTACRQREHCVIATDAHVGTSLVLGASLADKNGAGVYELLVTHLQTKMIGVTVAAVLDRALSFFMCHG